MYVSLYRVPLSERVRDIISSHLTNLNKLLGAYFPESERVNDFNIQVIHPFAIPVFSNSQCL